MLECFFFPFYYTNEAQALFQEKPQGLYYAASDNTNMNVYNLINRTQ